MHPLTSRSVLRWQSAIFNFQALLIVMLLTICTCAYLRANIR